MVEVKNETLVERLRSNAALPICPFERRSPEYYTTPNDQPCKFCGGLPEGPDKCTGADMRIMLEAADEIERLRALSVSGPSGGGVEEQQPVAWQPRYAQEVIDHHRSQGADFWEWAMSVYPTKSQAENYGHGGHEVRPLYATPTSSTNLLGEEENEVCRERRYAWALPDTELLKDAREHLEELDGFNSLDFDSDSEVACQRSHGIISALLERFPNTEAIATPTKPDEDRMRERVVGLEKALAEIRDLEPAPFNSYPADWQEQIDACEDCQRYKGHPVMHGRCSAHWQPVYDREKHDAHEVRALGYRARSIARDALANTSEAP